MVKCNPPNCVCKPTSKKGVCSKPNNWHIFRKVNCSQFNRETVSRKYKAAKARMSSADWCNMASTIGMDRCNVLVNPNDPAPPEDVCTSLAADIVPQDAQRNATIRWQRVMRILHTHRFPTDSIGQKQTSMPNAAHNSFKIHTIPVELHCNHYCRCVLYSIEQKLSFA